MHKYTNCEITEEHIVCKALSAHKSSKISY